MNMYVGLDTG